MSDLHKVEYTLSQVNERIKVADQKAIFFASFNFIGLFIQLNSLSFTKFTSLLPAILLFFLVMLWFLSIIILLMIISPRLNNWIKKSKIYFWHISDAYSTDGLSAIDDYRNWSDLDFFDDISTQIVQNSLIAKCKYKLLQKLTYIFFWFILLSVFIQVINLI